MTTPEALVILIVLLITGIVIGVAERNRWRL